MGHNSLCLIITIQIKIVNDVRVSVHKYRSVTKNMRFQTTLQKDPKHTELVSCIGWTTAEEAFSAADDHQILKWNLVNFESSVLVKLPDDVFPTDMHWLPKATAGAKKQVGSDLFALGSTDGK